MTSAAAAQLRQVVLDTLAENEYTVLDAPLLIGDITLDLGTVCVGPADRLDVAVVVEQPNTKESGLQLYWQIQRLARALDAIGSRRTITVVVLGVISESRLHADLQTVARVLTVDESLPIRRLLAPLLALEVPEGARSPIDGLGMLRETLRGRRSNDLITLTHAARGGSSAVRAEYIRWIDDAFSTGLGARHE